METQKNNIEKERMKIIKFVTFIFSIGIVVLIIAIIVMTIGIIQFNLKEYATSVTAVYIVSVLSLFTQWIPLWSIHKMLTDIKRKNQISQV